LLFLSCGLLLGVALALCEVRMARSDTAPSEAVKRARKAAAKETGRSKVTMVQVGMMSIAAVLAVALFAWFGDAVGRMGKPLEMEPLSLISMPTPEKYEQVKKDEATRLQLLGKQRTQLEQEEYDEGYRRNQFNQWISDNLSLHRRALDTRHVGCLSKKYHPISELGTVSVIIIFYNEARSTLMRTVHSVLDRTHPRLLKEIILVDDRSDMKHLGYALEREVAGLPKTKLIRLKERSGLIRAKVHGASAAHGDVILFLDSHCEVNDGYLEPLLDRIRLNRKTVAMPIIDAIEYETWEHRTGLLERGIFDWTLTFKWKRLTRLDEAERPDMNAPFRSPAMAGGLFAIDRKYFFEIGSYDMGMETWGGKRLCAHPAGAGGARVRVLFLSLPPTNPRPWSDAQGRTLRCRCACGRVVA
jgi:polypeptide N-acetylgalactosaminyltransferase